MLRQQPKRVLVCGSRDWQERSIIRAELGLLASKPNPPVIIHGAARGADTLAGQIAEGYGLTVERFPADWDTHGKRAGILRNLAMLDTEPDLVLAFRKGESRGTQHTVSEAMRRGIPTRVYVADHYYSHFHVEESEPIHA